MKSTRTGSGVTSMKIFVAGFAGALLGIVLASAAVSAPSTSANDNCPSNYTSCSAEGNSWCCPPDKPRCGDRPYICQYN